MRASQRASPAHTRWHGTAQRALSRMSGCVLCWVSAVFNLTLQELEQQWRQLAVKLLPLPVLSVREDANAADWLVGYYQRVCQRHCQQSLPLRHVLLQQEAPVAKQCFADSNRPARVTQARQLRVGVFLTGCRAGRGCRCCCCGWCQAGPAVPACCCSWVPTGAACWQRGALLVEMHFGRSLSVCLCVAIGV